jgi:3-methyladenine DNA glycosylase AlkC
MCDEADAFFCGPAMVDATRKGAARIADIPPDILAYLNAGRIAAVTLVENLATDFGLLLTNTLPELADASRTIDPKDGVTKRMAAVAAVITHRYGAEKLPMLAAHPSDLVRGWAAYVVVALPNRALPDRLADMRPFADDPHFGVREWAWIAMRPHLAADLDHALHLLAGWAADPSERIRRFSCEAIRPRGVWCAHIPLLKDHPEHAFALLEKLRADPARYVQDSVGNWLNDAAKDQPAKVRDLCARWSRESPVPSTIYICKRALRSLDSKA